MNKHQLHLYNLTFHEMVLELEKKRRIVILFKKGQEYIIEGKRGIRLTIRLGLQLNIFGEADIFFFVDGYGLYDSETIEKLTPKVKTRHLAA